MSFVVAADAYDRFMGRYSVPLAPALADFAGIEGGERVLDVGCGPGALTTELVRRVGPAAVAAVDPSEPFVAAARERHPGVDVQRAAAEELPFEDGSFDAALAQLVVHFMADPVAGLREMARVTRGGGVVAACVWDLAGGRAPLSPFWDAARELDPGVEDESKLAGAREGHLARALSGRRPARGPRRPFSRSASSIRRSRTWWEPFTLGVGPAGGYAASLDATQQARLRELCRERLPAGAVRPHRARLGRARPRLGGFGAISAERHSAKPS